MYGYFLKLFGPRTAGLVTALWYAAILVGIILCSVADPADFRYGRY